MTTRLLLLLHSRRHTTTYPGKTRLLYQLTSTYNFSTTKKSKDDDDVDDPTAWIPPPRPLAGDKTAPFPNKSNKERTVEFIDFDSIDLDSLKHAKMNEWITEEEVDDEHVFLDPEAMEDDDENEENDDIDDISEEDKELVQYYLDELEKQEKEKQNKEEKTKKEGDEVWESTSMLDSFLENETKSSSDTETNESEAPDWLRIRNEKLGQPIEMLTPEDATAARNIDGHIPTIKHKLLTADEITSCLEALGGQNIRSIKPAYGNWGSIQSLIFATGYSASHLRTMADSIHKSLRNRNLQKLGVVGAQDGIEGRDCDDWMIVDCLNYHVHLMDEETREDLNLEEKWGNKANCEDHLDFSDEDVCDDYIMRNPVPERYARRVMRNETVDVYRDLKKMKWKRNESEWGEKKKKKRRKKRGNNYRR